MGYLKSVCFFAGGLLIGAFATALIIWPPQQSSDWASWMQAIGAIVGIAIAIYVPYRQQDNGEIRDRKRDEQRRQEPLMTLRPIMERAFYLISQIPRDGGSTTYVEYYFTHVSNTAAVSTVHKSLAAFPVEKLVDYQAVQSVFEMQDALQLAIDSLSDISAAGAAWDRKWHARKPRIEIALARADVAKSQLKAALDGAGVTNYVSGSGTAMLDLNVRETS